MLTINGTIYLPKGAPCAAGNHLYKEMAGGVLLMDPDGKPFAFVVNNRHGERFIVSCSRREDGRIWYMYALSDADAPKLGLPEDYYRGSHDLAENIIRQLHPPRPFEIGQPVATKEFTDCFGKLHPREDGYLVDDIELVTPGSIPAYYKIRAIRPGGHGMFTGAERFFEASHA